MNRALFLDRDGVVNLDDGYTHRIETLRFVPGVFDLCRAAAARGFLLVIVTNQAGIGRGYYTEAEYRRFTAEMLGKFAAAGLAIAAVYHCPFHPDGVGPYRREHPWRKPNPGMLLDAARALDLDLAASALIGDGARDMAAARRAGLGTAVRIASPDAADRQEGAPDAVLDSVGAALAWFEERFPGR
jgi:D-glycero-D-manno-heptose 1,7-bisphosphate phosphatase